MIKAAVRRMTTNPAREGLPAAEFEIESQNSDNYVPSHDDIAAKAYSLYLIGGSNPDHHWLLAEKQLITEHFENRLHKRHS